MSPTYSQKRSAISFGYIYSLFLLLRFWPGHSSTEYIWPFPSIAMLFPRNLFFQGLADNWDGMDMDRLYAAILNAENALGPAGTSLEGSTAILPLASPLESSRFGAWASS